MVPQQFKPLHVVEGACPVLTLWLLMNKSQYFYEKLSDDLTHPKIGTKHPDLWGKIFNENWLCSNRTSNR